MTNMFRSARVANLRLMPRLGRLCCWIHLWCGNDLRCRHQGCLTPVTPHAAVGLVPTHVTPASFRCHLISTLTARAAINGMPTGLATAVCELHGVAMVRYMGCGRSWTAVVWSAAAAGSSRSEECSAASNWGNGMWRTGTNGASATVLVREATWGHIAARRRRTSGCNTTGMVGVSLQRARGD